jgi:hypothetical protein
MPGDLFSAPEADGDASGITTVVECGRPIEVTDARIWTDGPTLVTTLAPSGAPLAGGLEMRCMGLDATRIAGEIVHVTAPGPVAMKRGGIQGFGERLLYDPRTGWLTLEGGDRPAEIVSDRGPRGAGDVLAYNVRTHAIGVVRGTWQ